MNSCIPTNQITQRNGHIPKTTQTTKNDSRGKRKSNRPIQIKRLIQQSKNFQQKKIPVPDGFSGKFYKTPILLKLF